MLLLSAGQELNLVQDVFAMVHGERRRTTAHAYTAHSEGEEQVSAGNPVDREQNEPAQALVDLRRRLADALARNGGTKQQLAQRTRLGRTVVSNAFSPTQPAPTDRTVAALAKALKLDDGPLLDLLSTARGDEQPHTVSGTASNARSMPAPRPGAAGRKPVADERVISELKQAFLALLRHASKIPPDDVNRLDNPPTEIVERQRGAEHAWDQEWQPLVAHARMAALEIRHGPLRRLLADEGLRYLADWNDDLRYAFFRRSRPWVLEQTVTYLYESVLALQRGEAVPEPSPCYQEVKSSWELRQEELRALYDEE
ncbi:hypothetical protein ACPMJQ_34680 [Streptomyces pseudogriseolus]|uniref:hypothetical protein n=1 Tax=Streptomyces pseudogriseolus TaxID=36817 RepID=UPI003FA2111E